MAHAATCIGHAAGRAIAASIHDPDPQLLETGMKFGTTPAESRASKARPRVSAATFIKPERIGTLIAATAHAPWRARQHGCDSPATAQNEVAQQIVHPREESIYDVPSAPWRSSATADAGYATPLAHDVAGTESGSDISLPVACAMPKGMSQVYAPQDSAVALALLLARPADEKAAESPYQTPIHRANSKIWASFRKARGLVRLALRNGTAGDAAAPLAEGPMAASASVRTGAWRAGAWDGKRVTQDMNQTNGGIGERYQASFMERLWDFVSRPFKTIIALLRSPFGA